MSDTVPVPVLPNDPAVVASLAAELATLITTFKDSVDAWQAQVDQIVVRLQNAGNATTLPDGGVTGQTPSSGPGTPSTPEPLPDLPPDPAPATTTDSTPPEDHSQTIHDPSGDDTFTDPSGDDTITFP